MYARSCNEQAANSPPGTGAVGSEVRRPTCPTMIAVECSHRGRDASRKPLPRRTLDARGPWTHGLIH